MSGQDSDLLMTLCGESSIPASGSQSLILGLKTKKNNNLIFTIQTFHAKLFAYALFIK